MLKKQLSPEGLSEATGYSVGTLANMRVRGEGPPYRKLSPRKVVYDPDDVQAWLDARKVSSTSDTRGA